MKVRKKVRNRSLKGKARRGTTIVTEVEVSPKSPYMGSRITVSNRREFIASKKEQYIKMHTEGYESRKAEILRLEGTEEEKANELAILDEKQMSPEQLEKSATDFARYEVNKESKHYNAYVKGLKFFKYRGLMHPVLTEEFLMNSKGLKEIHKLEESNEQTIITPVGREIVEGADTDSVPSSDEGRVSETV